MSNANPAQLLSAYAVLFDMQRVVEGKLVNDHVVDVVPVQIREGEASKLDVVQAGLQALREGWDVEQHGDFEQFRLARAKVVLTCREWVISGPSVNKLEPFREEPETPSRLRWNPSEN